MKTGRLLFIVLVCGTLICLEQIVSACADIGDPYDDSFSFFQNNLSGNPAYMPFYYISGLEYYSDWNGLDNDDKDSIPDENLHEWVTYGKNAFSSAEAAAFVYRYARHALNNLYYHIEQNKPLKLPDSIRINGMTRWFLKRKDLEALGYLMFAKQCEPYTGGSANEWEAPKRDTAAMGRLMRNGLQLWEAAKAPFFRDRYAFQILRLSFYAGEYQHTLDLYARLIKEATPSVAFYRSLSLKAGACYHMQDYNQAAYLYSRAFDADDSKKLSNYISYNWCFRPHGEGNNGGRAEQDQVLAQARNNHEKSIIYLMQALHERDHNENALPFLQQAYALDAAVNGLDVAMTREINKIESSYLNVYLANNGLNRDDYLYSSSYYYNYFEKYRAQQLQEARTVKSRISALIAFGEQLYNDRKATNPAFWPLSVAYLYFMQQDWDQTERWITRAEALHPSPGIKDMISLEKLLLAINKKKTIDASIEEDILPSLKWLEDKARKQKRYTIAYRNLLGTVLSNAYLKQADTIKAVLLLEKSLMVTDPSPTEQAAAAPLFIDPGTSNALEQLSIPELTRLRDWIKRNNKTPYEAWLIREKPYETGKLGLYIGTRYIRAYRFEEAAKVLQDIPAGLLHMYAFEDPFAERWKDTQEPADTEKMTDRYLFAKDMARLQSGISGASAAEIYRYANGLYSMTYYGRGWAAGAYYRSGADGWAYYADSNRSRLSSDYQNYYNAHGAARYYQMAYDKSADPELKAKCLFMLSKCWQKTTPSRQDYHYDPQENNDYVEYTLKSPYFRLLHDNYAQTYAYKELWEDCSYLRYFVKKTY